MASRGGIRLSLEQLRIATKRNRKKMPDCHNETMKLIQSLHRDNYNLKSIYPLVKAAEDCMQESYKRKKANKGAAKASPLYYLSKYVKR